MKATTTKGIDLNGYKNRQEVIEKLTLQINKDLELNIDLSRLETSVGLYQELVELIKPNIHDLIRVGSGKVEQLLYKIDVEEAKVKEAIDSAVETDPALIFTQLILERELQKVVFRLLYSKGITP